MICNKNAVFAALTATTFLTASAAWAASQQTADQQKSTPEQTAADKDFGKLSADGSRAFEELTLTRLAIYDGRIADAKKYVNEADTALGKAKTDEAVFTKAQADLKTPTSKDPSANKNVSGAAPVDNADGEKIPGAPSGMLTEMADPKKPIAWLPVDGVITINEDYTANPAKKSAVADANKSLKSGDRKSAVEKLKLADMKVDVTLAVIPLEQTIKYTHQAASLINDNKYYEASQVLRQAQDNLRFTNISDTLSIAEANSTPTSPGGMFTNVPAQDELSSNVVGLDVYNRDKQNIGTIKDIVFSESGLSGYIIGVGGFLGMDEHYVVVRPTAISLGFNANDKKWHATMNANADQVKAAPEYKYPSKL